MQRFAERQKQIELAKQRHEEHIGLSPDQLREARRLKKESRRESHKNI